jgi:putative DNA primase/helicase
MLPPIGNLRQLVNRGFMEIEQFAEEDFEQLIMEQLKREGRSVPDEHSPSELQARNDERGALTQDSELLKQVHGEHQTTVQDPIPLPPVLKPAPSFDLNMLPNSFRPFVEDVSKRFHVPPDYPAVALFTNFSSVCGGRIGIMPKANDSSYCEYPNNFGVIIGRPSVGKSPVVSECLRFVNKLDEAFHEENQQEKKRHNRLEAEREAKLKALRKAAEKHENSSPAVDREREPFNYSEFEELLEPNELIQKRLILMDGSTEALIEVARQNPEGFLFHQDELKTLFAITQKQGNECMRGLILTAWNGKNSYKIDRIGRGMNQRIERVNFSILGTAQPGVMADMLKAAIKGGAADDGLMQRFQLACYPDIEPNFKYEDIAPDQQAIVMVRDAFRSIFDGIYKQRGALEQNSSWFYHFNVNAQGLFREWLTAHMTELRGGNFKPGLEAHLTKYQKTVPTLALMIHLADGHIGPVCEVCTMKALDMAEYLRGHAERIYSLSENLKENPTKRLLREIRDGKLSNPFTERDVYLKGWSDLNDQDAVGPPAWN